MRGGVGPGDGAMSDTPRTDSMEPYGPPYCGDGAILVHVPKTFARQLERELGAARPRSRLWSGLWRSSTRLRSIADRRKTGSTTVAYERS